MHDSDFPDDAAQTERTRATIMRYHLSWKHRDLEAVLALYGAGIGLAWHYRAALAQPFASSFGTLLTLKICLALSILGHFILVVLLMRSGRMTPARSRLIHLSVLVQMLAILFLAKAMFLLSW